MTDDEGVARSVWRVSDRDILRKISGIMKSKQIFIADGHHRYETALAYRESQRSKFPDFRGKETFNFTMMYLAAMEDRGIFILPTHRVVHDLENFGAPSFLEQLRPDFSVQAFDFGTESESAVRDRFLRELASRADRGRCLGMLLGGERKYFLLSLRRETPWTRPSPGCRPA